VSTNDPLNTHVVNSSPTGGAAETVTVTITTTANASSPPLFFDPKIRFWLPIGVLGILLSTFVAFVMRRGRPALLPAYALIAFILVMALIVGCGGGGGYTPPPSSGGTTSGNYQVTVSAFTESNTSGNADATAQIPLTVN
jgi:hypothetical protein